MISNIYTLKAPEYFGFLLYNARHGNNERNAYSWNQEEIDATFYMLYLLKHEKVYDAVGNLCKPDHTVMEALEDFYNDMDKTRKCTKHTGIIIMDIKKNV